jgi:hypothetical protein
MDIENDFAEINCNNHENINFENKEMIIEKQTR